MELSIKVHLLFYSSLVNILKNLGDHPNLFKCHKMLKTSHNLYVVYDLMGKYPTLSHLLENKLINGQVKSNFYFISRKEYRFTNS